MATNGRETPREVRERFRAFVDAQVVPQAGRWDREEQMPLEVIRALAGEGWLGALVPAAYGGAGMDALTFGHLNEALGRGCSSLRSLLTVHSMACQAVMRWGSQAQRDYWLPALAKGEALGAFALTEPQAGSDVQRIATTATADGDSYVLNGRKRWITFGEIAHVFLLFARIDGQPAAFLVEADRPGFRRDPIRGMLGVRASMLAELSLEDCRIPRDALLARPGFGLSHVALSALDWGRYSVAWGCVGIVQACLEASLRYTRERETFGAPLSAHPLIRQQITEMMTGVRAARLLCEHAGRLREEKEPSAIMETSIAKYFASQAAMKAALDAVQIHGANGCSPDFPVERFMRDAKIMEVIEGSTQMQQLAIADYAWQAGG